MEKKKLISILFAGLLFFTFIIGYNIGLNKESKIKKDTKDKKQQLNLDVSVGKIRDKKILNKIVSKDAEIIFEMECTNESKYMIERRKKAEDEGIVGKKGIELEKIYKKAGYVVKEINDNKVEMIRGTLKYKPNSYILMTENNEIIIAHSDKNGSVFDSEGNILDRQGTGTFLESLRAEDISNIINGHESIQYATNTELNDSIKDFDIKYEIPE
ncbi:hypothetical protein [Clostridium ganghwense]|uniref:Bypass of forespore C C-terminal domain-containing protein n=1 Tax=Clostridium ganghwense TaxID=312089 RepID=A0ABT4CR47_9CLOT|nr:hypothetical protein [Clostridium ganghwense]MCY6370469.1 hypothetical protein [Clostridium ganghwense]